MPNLQTCAQCATTPTAPKRCGRCKSVAYCNHECQKSHWKTHKKDCARLAQNAGQASEPPKPAEAAKPKPTASTKTKPFTAINDNTFLHNRSEEETFKLLIDLLRLRQEDELQFEGTSLPGSIYDAKSTSEAAFRELIRKAANVPNLLPLWWTDEKLEQCFEYARTNHVFSLASSVEKTDVIEQWVDNMMPMKLRMTGERIYGNTPGGSASGSILGLMMGHEGGTGPQFVSGFDMSALFSGRR
ncbi:hypothetical protein Q7P37_002420 [Cladosporium fusiforme]